MIQHTRTKRTRTVTYLATRIFTEAMKIRAFSVTEINAPKYLWIRFRQEPLLHLLRWVRVIYHIRTRYFIYRKLDHPVEVTKS